MYEDVDEIAPIISQSSMNCTVVSIMPFALKEHKPQIYPGYFQIPASKDGSIQCLPVGDSIHWMESPFKGMPPIKITETSKVMARSIINDYVEAQLAIDSNAFPGIFWVEGHYGSGGIKQDHKAKLEAVRDAQNNWFVNLVRIADDDWQKSHQHQAISDKQRFAAKALGLDREWLSVTSDFIPVKCPACKEMVHPEAIVHAACGYILDLKKYEQLQDRIIKKADRILANPLDVIRENQKRDLTDLEYLNQGETK